MLRQRRHRRQEEDGDVDSGDGQNNFFPLHDAATQVLSVSDLQATVELFTASALWNRDPQGLLPVHCAIKARQYPEIVQYLLERTEAAAAAATNGLDCSFDALLLLHYAIQERAPMTILELFSTEKYSSYFETGDSNGSLPLALEIIMDRRPPRLNVIKYLTNQFREGVIVTNHDGLCPLFLAACDNNALSLSVVYTLIREEPNCLSHIALNERQR